MFLFNNMFATCLFTINSANGIDNNPMMLSDRYL